MKKKSVRFETKLCTKKMTGLILGDMTRHTVYQNPQHSEACDNGVLLYMRK